MSIETKSAYTTSLPSDTELVMTRTFNAPRELVFRAHLDPELVAQWWGWRRYTTIVEELDARPGGKWRFVQRAADGSFDMACFGEFREVLAPERFTWTFGFDGLTGEPGVETYAFTEHEGRTTLTVTSYFKTKEERDALNESGMEDGANESGDRLEELLARLLG
jgi:uncharacterized protein YndB with AHSA1/START domain